MVKVDAHCHIGMGHWKRQTVDDLLRQMDRCGVEKAVVCPVDQYIAVYNREGNDDIAEAVRAHPDRLIGFATVNPWYGEQGVRELERAVGNGLSGLKINSSLQGFFIHDPLIYPLMEKVQELRIPAYFHTNTPVHAMPFQLADLAGQFPEVSFILGHMGFADGWTDAVPAVKDLDHVFLETSLTGPMVIEAAIRTIDPVRIVFGSNSPESSLSVELAKVTDMDLSEEVRQMILGENMTKLLNRN